MNPLVRQWFYRGFHRKLTASLGKDEADPIRNDAGKGSDPPFVSCNQDGS